MRASNRIIVNTLAQYARTIVNLLLSLYSARLVLDILGVEDYGIFTLVAGVVSMLSFLTNSLVGSTQRFLSIYQGKGELGKLREVFGNSLLLHLFLGFIVWLVLEGIAPLLFNGFLNIPENRTEIASVVYQLVIGMVYISFVAAPYRALLVSRENIVYTSLIDVADGILKVILVILLRYVSFDKLEAYGWVMLGINSFNLVAFALYTHAKYEECVFPRFRSFSYSYLKELFSFTGWITYSSVCIALRNQGVAIVLNRFWGTIVNAAYGIGSQISGMVSFVSVSFNNAIAPQLMAAEGGGNRSHMWRLAELESKFSFLLLAMVGIPTLFEMRSLLELWLVEVPDHTILFGRMFLLMQIIDMLTTGLGLANRAMGKIRWYTVLTYTPKLLILPLGWYALYLGKPLWIIAVLMILIEGVCMLLRIPLLRDAEGFDAKEYVRAVFFRSMPPAGISALFCVLFCHFLEFHFRFVLTFILSILLFTYSAYRWSLNEPEQDKVRLVWQSVWFRIRRG